MNFVGIRRVLFVLTLLVSGIFHPARAAMIIVQPAADTTLIEKEPNNNLGGADFVNVGTTGMNAGGTKNRALFQFDFSAIPPASKIRAAAVVLEVRFQSAVSPAPATYELHRVFKPWGEGDKFTNISPGLGVLATINEATWSNRFALTTNTWTVPGGSNDYAAVISSSVGVSGLDFPRFESRAQMISDVQTWLNNPSVNFGWLLKVEAEEIHYTARGFGSREFLGGDTNSPPYVEVEFVPPPIISGAQITNSQFRFSFLAESNQTYAVEFKNTLASTNLWLPLTNIAAPIASTNILVSDSISTNARFYRVVFQ